jgi:hypothetical protein
MFVLLVPGLLREAKKDLFFSWAAVAGERGEGRDGLSSVASLSSVGARQSRTCSAGDSGSEAAVERTFSLQAAVHSKQRNRLLDSTVEAEMFLRFNERSINHPMAAAEPQCAEMDDDLNDSIPPAMPLCSRCGRRQRTC